jgi:hypothetical protein
MTRGTWEEGRLYGTLAATTRPAEPVGALFQRRGPNCASMMAAMARIRTQKCSRVDMVGNRTGGILN